MKFAGFEIVKREMASFMSSTIQLEWKNSNENSIEGSSRHHKMKSDFCEGDRSRGKKRRCSCVKETTKECKPKKSRCRRVACCDRCEKMDGGQVDRKGCGSKKTLELRCRCVSERQKESVEECKRCRDCGSELCKRLQRERQAKVCKCTWVRK